MKLLIAAGGTGGHLFPGIAVAEVFKEMNPAGEVVFVGSERGLEKEILEREGFPHRALNVGRIKGEGMAQKLKTLFSLPGNLMEARALLKELQPDVVLGIGGYSSGPMILAAFLAGLPRAVLEPNAIPGFTNRILGRFVKKVFVAFPEAEKFFSKSKVKRTGTPVRKKLSDVGANRTAPHPLLTREGVKGEVFTMTIIGGSQGATALNRAVTDMLPRLKPGRLTYRIIHQTGPNDAEWVRKAYETSGIEHRVSEFIEDMASVYAETDLLICRAGASTVAEAVATRTPAIFVPYPFAADDHQRFNALAVVEAGGAEMIMNRDLNEKLASRAIHLAESPETLRTMKDNLRAMSLTPAADAVTRECLSMVLA